MGFAVALVVLGAFPLVFAEHLRLQNLLVGWAAELSDPRAELTYSDAERLCESKHNGELVTLVASDHGGKSPRLLKAIQFALSSSAPSSLVKPSLLASALSGHRTLSFWVSRGSVSHKSPKNDPIHKQAPTVFDTVLFHPSNLTYDVTVSDKETRHFGYLCRVHWSKEYESNPVDRDLIGISSLSNNRRRLSGAGDVEPWVYAVSFGGLAVCCIGSLFAFSMKRKADADKMKQMRQLQYAAKHKREERAREEAEMEKQRKQGQTGTLANGESGAGVTSMSSRGAEDDEKALEYVTPGGGAASGAAGVEIDLDESNDEEGDPDSEHESDDDVLDASPAYGIAVADSGQRGTVVDEGDEGDEGGATTEEKTRMFGAGLGAMKQEEDDLMDDIVGSM